MNKVDEIEITLDQAIKLFRPHFISLMLKSGIGLTRIYEILTEEVALENSGTESTILRCLIDKLLLEQPPAVISRGPGTPRTNYKIVQCAYPNGSKSPTDSDLPRINLP